MTYLANKHVLWLWEELECVEITCGEHVKFHAVKIWTRAFSLWSKNASYTPSSPKCRHPRANVAFDLSRVSALLCTYLLNLYWVWSCRNTVTSNGSSWNKWFISSRCANLQVPLLQSLMLLYFFIQPTQISSILRYFFPLFFMSF